MKKILVLFAVVVLASCAGPMGGDLSENSTLATERAVSATGKQTLLLVGDSRVFLWPEGFFEDYDVTNIAVGGTNAMWSAQEIAKQTKRYDVAIISTGVNDYVWRKTLNETVYALCACIVQAKLKADRVIITTIPGARLAGDFTLPIVSGISIRAAQVNYFVPIIAGNYFIEYVDIATPLCIDFLLREEYDDGSGIHYNLAGYEVIYDLYMQALGE